jgi:phosphoribosylaminoimidazole-succinocarboxamide synthase
MKRNYQVFGGIKLISEEIIKKQIGKTLTGTDLKLGTKYKGKVRDVYEDKGKVFLISTDRQSAFDRNLAQIPFKGQVLTQTSAFWFEQTKDIIQNHTIDVPDPNVVVGKKLKVFPVEMVIRGYLTGVTDTAAWTAYAKGERMFCGNELPEGMKKNQKFPEPIITPTTKSEEHDEKISAEEIVKQVLMTQKQWDYVADKTKKIFQRGQDIAAKNGLILVDTKYEFGHDEEGNIYLIDEIHTPDSSRFWLKDSYEQRFSDGKEPENIDKEFLRLWFKENSDPYKDEVLPDAPEELVVELSKRYIQLYEMITSQEFKAEPGDIKERIEHNLKGKGYM